MPFDNCLKNCYEQAECSRGGVFAMNIYEYWVSLGELSGSV
jgi:hypothetical protein